MSFESELESIANEVYGVTPAPAMPEPESPYAAELESIANEVYSNPEYAPKLFVEKDRGFAGDVASSLARGTLGAVKGVAGALRMADLDPTKDEGILGTAGKFYSDMANKAEKQYDIFKPDIAEVRGEENFVKRGIRGAVESTPASLTPLAGGIAGAAIGTAVLPGPGTVIGGIIGGGATLFATFGLGTYQNTFDDTVKTLKEKGGLPDDEINRISAKHALTSAAYEAGTEVVGDLAALTFFGAFGKNAIKQTLKQSIKQLVSAGGIKDFGTALLKDIPFEAGSEVLAAYGQTKSAQEAGISNESTAKAMTEAVLPIVFMSLIFGGSIRGMQAVEARSLYAKINSQNVDERIDAAKNIASRLDKEERVLWLNTAKQHIDSGKEIPISQPIVDYATQKADADESAQTPPLDSFREKFAKGELTPEELAMAKEIWSDDPAFVAGIDEILKPAPKATAKKEAVVSKTAAVVPEKKPDMYARNQAVIDEAERQELYKEAREKYGFDPETFAVPVGNIEAELRNSFATKVSTAIETEQTLPEAERFVSGLTPADIKGIEDKVFTEWNAKAKSAQYSEPYLRELYAGLEDNAFKLFAQKAAQADYTDTGRPPLAPEPLSEIPPAGTSPVESQLVSGQVPEVKVEDVKAEAKTVPEIEVSQTVTPVTADVTDVTPEAPKAKEVAGKTEMKPEAKGAGEDGRGVGGIHNKIFEILDNDISEDLSYGIRVIPADSKPIKIGSKLSSSFKWLDNERSNTRLPGTSVIEIKKSISNEQTKLEIKNAIKTLRQHGYSGDVIALVRGEFVKNGSDPGESILRKPEVVHLFSKSDLDPAKSAPASVPKATAGEAPKPIISAETGTGKAEKQGLTTLTGRKVSPPKIRVDTSRKATIDSLKADAWLRDEAIKEAMSKNDKFNLFQFEHIDPKKMTQAEKEGMHVYLWGDVRDIFQLTEIPVVKAVAEETGGKDETKVEGKTQNEYVQERLDKLKKSIKLKGQAKNLYLLEWQDRYEREYQRKVSEIKPESKQEKAIPETKHDITEPVIIEGKKETFKEFLDSKKINPNIGNEASGLYNPTLHKQLLAEWKGETPKVDEVKIEGGKEKTVSVDMPKKKEDSLKPKEQKEYLLAEIDKAINTHYKETDSPPRLIELIKSGESNFFPPSDTVYTFEVPGDGEFKVTGSNLQEFQKRAQKFPTSISRKGLAETGGKINYTAVEKWFDKITGKPENLKSTDIPALLTQVEEKGQREAEGGWNRSTFQDHYVNWLLSKNVSKKVIDYLKNPENRVVELEESPKAEEQYSVGKETKGQTLTKERIGNIFKTGTVTQDGDNYLVSFKNGLVIPVQGVAEITPNRIALLLGYSQSELKPGQRVTAAFDGKKITIVKEADDLDFALAHDSYHVLRKLGIISDQDETVIVAQAKKEGAWNNKRNVEENAADWLADFVTGNRPERTSLRKLWDKIKGFINGIVGIRTAEQIGKELKSGRIFEGKGQKALSEGMPQFSLKEAVTDKPVTEADIRAAVERHNGTYDGEWKDFGAWSVTDNATKTSFMVRTPDAIAKKFAEARGESVEQYSVETKSKAELQKSFLKKHFPDMAPGYDKMTNESSSVSDVINTKNSMKWSKDTKKDLSWFDKAFSSAEFYSEKDPAYKRYMEAIFNAASHKYELQNQILGTFVDSSKELKQNDKRFGTNQYQRLSDYLDKTDRFISGYSIKEITTAFDEQSFEIYSQPIIGTVNNLAEAAKLTKGNADAFVAPSGNKFVVLGKKELAGEYATEKEAVAAMTEYEVADYVKQNRNASDAELEALRDTRSATNEQFDLLTEQMRQMIAESKAKNEAEMQVIVGFEEQKDGSQVPIRKPLSWVLNEMGNLRGSYMPRQRPQGKYVLIAKRGENDRIREHFDLPATEDTSKLAGIGKLTIPMQRRANELVKQGYTVTYEKSKALPETVFEAAKLVAATDAMLKAGLENIEGTKEGEALKTELSNLLSEAISNLFKARGFRSQMIKRGGEIGDAVWKGYETDLSKRVVGAANSVASGIAKRDKALNMMLAIMGRDISFAEYQAQNPNPKGPGYKSLVTYKDYIKMVEARRIDPKTQQAMYADIMDHAREVLRNDEAIDRIVGTAKGVASVWFLGFRVSSAAVNATNMAVLVPAVMHGIGKIPYSKTFGLIGSAMKSYVGFRMGKQISASDSRVLTQVKNRGWDAPQFNQDAYEALLNKTQGAWNTFTSWGMRMFSKVEELNRGATILAAFNGLDPKLSFEDRLAQAKHISDRAHGIYDKSTRPSIARGTGLLPAAARAAVTFTKYTHTYLLDLLQLAKTEKSALAVGHMLLAPAILGGLGSSILFPIIAAAAKAVGFGGDDPEEEWYKYAEENWNMGTWLRHGLAGLGGYGVNLKGSLSIGFTQLNSLESLLGAPYAVPANIVKGVAMAAKGEVAKGIEKAVPLAIGVPLRGIRESSKGLTTGGGAPIFYGKLPVVGTPLEAMWSFLAFNPSRTSAIKEELWNERKVEQIFTERKSDIYAKYRKMWKEGITAERFGELTKETELFNEDVNKTKDLGFMGVTPITHKTLKAEKRKLAKPSKKEQRRIVDYDEEPVEEGSAYKPMKLTGGLKGINLRKAIQLTK